MKKYSVKILVAFLILPGCNATDEPEPEILEDTPLSDLYRVLESNLLQPKDSLLQIRYYASAEGEANWMQDYYYDRTGKQALVVAKTADADTLGLSVFKYDESGKKTRRINFTKENGTTAWDSSVEFVYNSDNLEAEIYLLNTTRTKSLFTQKFYTPSNQLIEIRYRTEAYVFDYDEKGLVTTEKWILLDAPSQPLSTLFYRHDSLGRLVAKEIHINADVPERKDAFQYYYHESVKLKEEREYDIRFGYSLKQRKEYIYRTN